MKAGERLSLEYCDSSAPLTERQRVLRSFDIDCCNCPLCIEDRAETAESFGVRAALYKIFKDTVNYRVLANDLSVIPELSALVEQVDATYQPGRVYRLDLSALLPMLKKDESTAWLAEVNSQSLQSALINLDSAFSHFFHRVKTGSGVHGIRLPSLALMNVAAARPRRINWLT